MYENFKMRNLFYFICCLFIICCGCTMQNPSSENREIIRKKMVPKPETMLLVAMPESAQKSKANQGDNEIKISDWIPKNHTASYNPEGKIDPFAPLFTKLPDDPLPKTTDNGSIAKPEPIAVGQCASTPLVKIGLNQLKLVGIVRSRIGNSALVQESSDKGYIVKEGECIGIHFGRVSEILADRIIIEERFKDHEYTNGKWQPTKIFIRERELKLQKPAGT